MNKKKIFIVLFLMVIFIPFFLFCISRFFNKTFDIKLKGYFEEPSVIEFSYSTYLSKEYQKAKEKRFNNNLIPRGILITLYNQIQYSLFDLSNRIVGKDKYFFEYDYIDAECCLSDESNFAINYNVDKIREYVEHLQNIQKKLSKFNKKFIFYITPSKAHYCFDKIPLKYRLCDNDQKISAYDELIEELKKTEINYIDSREVIEEIDLYPIFYKSGIHWSRPIEQLMSKKIVEKITELSEQGNYNLVLNEIEESNFPFWRDADVYDLANIFSKSPEKYYQYKTKFDEFGEDFPNIFLQGGSFASGLIEDVIKENSNLYYYMNYNNYVQGFDYFRQINTFNDIEMQKILDDCNFIVIEINEAVIKNCSNGFIEYFDSYLDSYEPIKNNILNNYFTRFDAEYNIGPENRNGFYWFEGKYSWVAPKCQIKLKNKNISEKGMQISLLVPNQLKEKTMKIDVKINNIYVNQISLNTSNKEEHIFIPAKQLPKSEVLDDYFKISLNSDFSFVPMQLGINEDARELSYLISYIGEVKNDF